MGYLPEALRNYLLRLGWSHGDDEIIPTEKAVEWFTLDHVGKSPSRMDFAKMGFINGHYLKHSSPQQLLPLVLPFIEQQQNLTLGEESKARILRALPLYQERTETLVQLAEQLTFLLAEQPLTLTDKGQETLAKEGTDGIAGLPEVLATAEWNEPSLDAAIQDYVKQTGIAFKKVGLPLRTVLTGSPQAPALPALLVALGREESLKRIRDGLQIATPQRAAS